MTVSTKKQSTAQSSAATKLSPSSAKLHDALIEKLNAEQCKAVETIEGPVMVVAGPGTGKTHVLAMRVAHILRKTQMRPSNILCLTFSTSGATAMRERLRSLIGSEAYGVTVKNFHTFCRDLIGEHPLVFDDWSAQEQISDVERYRELNKIIDQLMPDCVLVNKKNPYQRTRGIIDRISVLKREGMTDMQKLNEIVEEYEGIMQKKSREGTKQHEKNLLDARKFREFITVFERYQQMLQETQRYDYEDMILFVTQALRQHDWLLQSLQERYQYILVDEFQDTNGAQYDLVELLTTYTSVDHEPNLFIVGDDDQAIYRFQGANLTNLLRFHERFPSATTVTLTTSYRCNAEILTAASNMISHNTERLVGTIEGLTKDLVSANKESNTVPALLFAPSDMAEPWLVADLVQERIKNGMNPSDIAILTQTNRELFALYDVLHAAEVPLQMSGKVDLLSHPLVSQAIAIVRALVHTQSSAELSAALSCECFDCHPADIARLNALRYSEESTLLDLLLSLDDSASAAAKLPLADRDGIIQARDVILDLSNKVPSRTVVETLEHLLHESGLLRLAKGKNEKSFDPLQFAALQEFFDRVKYRAYEQSSLTIEGFLNDLEYYGNPEYGDLRLSYSLPHLSQEGVQLMTAHQSKGLEFETVILYSFRDRHWDRRHTRSSLSIPENLLFGWEKDQKQYEKNQDERRVAYVAMTRAKNELIFTCPKELSTGESMREVSPSAFFSEAGDLPEEVRELTSPERSSLLLYDPVRAFDQEYEAFLRSRLEDFALSVTALNHFLKNPKLFLEIDLLRTPQSKTSSLVYGNAVHDALKKWGLSLQEAKPFSKDAFLLAFETYLTQREVLTDAERQRLLKLGEESLPRYYDQKLSQQHPLIYKVEYAITTHTGDIPIKGKIDRIDLASPESAHVTVYDYKTGQSKTEKQIRDEGDYFRQLTFYKLLLQERDPLLVPDAFVLDFIGEGTTHPVERSFAVTDSEVRDLQKVIEAVWAKVQALDFSPL